MYEFTLSLHSSVRWLVLVVGVIAIVMAFSGWLRKSDYTETFDKVSLSFIILMDVNTLLGLLLYIFLSPITTAAFADFSAAMGDRTLRYFAVEHIAGMIVALVLVHVGRVLTKKAGEATKKYRAAVIWYLLALLILLAMIPWDRPLWRGF